jgi:hypothetical protein
MDFDTGNRPDPAGAGGSGGGTSVGPPGASASAGGEFDYRDPIQSFIVTVRRLVVEPVAFFRGMNRQGDLLNPLVFSLICWEISALIGGFLGVLGSIVGLGTRGVGEAIVGFLASLVFTPIVAAVFLLIASGIIHLLVMLIARPVGTSFETTFRVVAYADVSVLLSWIPILGGLAALVWYTVLSVFGVREAHNTSTGQAAAVVLIPVAIASFLLLVLAVVIGAVIFSAIS